MTPGKAAASPYFRITVVDEETGRGIPLVKLSTTNKVDYWTDSAGVVAFLEPELMDASVMLLIESFGYSTATDGFGRQTIQLVPSAGGSAVIRMKRDMPAQRIYRVTGTDIYRDSRLLGEDTPPTQDRTELPVTGMDSVQTAVYKGRMFWIWGDTAISGTNLGNFKATGAYSDLPDRGGLDPDVGVFLTFIREKNGWVKQMMPTDHQGMVWFGGLRTAWDSEGSERLYSAYTKLVPPMNEVEAGLALFNDDDRNFKVVWAYDKGAPIRLGGYPFLHVENGVEYFYQNRGPGYIRSRSDAASVEDLASYEALTCLREGAKADSADDPLDRDSGGRLRWGWKRGTPILEPRDRKALMDKGWMAPAEAMEAFMDAETGILLMPGGGSVCWNDYRKRWVRIFGGGGGDSLLGEIWYAEADTPIGPWVWSRKIITHAIKPKVREGAQRVDETKQQDCLTYSFYNVKQHPEFDKEGGRVIYLEGTYTMWLSNAKIPTPRYDYNQIMYKLELDDPRLRLPVPVYRVNGANPGYYTKKDLPECSMRTDAEIAFFAPDQPREGAEPVYRWRDPQCGCIRLSMQKPAGAERAEVAFHALPVLSDSASSQATGPLHEYLNANTGECIYQVEQDEALLPVDQAEASAGKQTRIMERYRSDLTGFARSAEPICRVWRNPIVFNPYRVE